VRSVDICAGDGKSMSRYLLFTFCNAVEVSENAAGVCSNYHTWYSERHSVALPHAQSLQVHVLSELCSMEIFVVWQAKGSPSRLLHNIPRISATGALWASTGSTAKFYSFSSSLTIQYVQLYLLERKILLFACQVWLRAFEEGFSLVEVMSCTRDHLS